MDSTATLKAEGEKIPLEMEAKQEESRHEETPAKDETIEYVLLDLSDEDAISDDPISSSKDVKGMVKNLTLEPLATDADNAVGKDSTDQSELGIEPTKAPVEMKDNQEITMFNLLRKSYVTNSQFNKVAYKKSLMKPKAEKDIQVVDSMKTEVVFTNPFEKKSKVGSKAAKEMDKLVSMSKLSIGQHVGKTETAGKSQEAKEGKSLRTKLGDLFKRRNVVFPANEVDKSPAKVEEKNEEASVVENYDAEIPDQKRDSDV